VHPTTLTPPWKEWLPNSTRSSSSCLSCRSSWTGHRPDSLALSFSLGPHSIPHYSVYSPWVQKDPVAQQGLSRFGNLTLFPLQSIPVIWENKSTFVRGVFSFFPINFRSFLKDYLPSLKREFLQTKLAPKSSCLAICSSHPSGVVSSFIMTQYPSQTIGAPPLQDGARLSKKLPLVFQSQSTWLHIPPLLTSVTSPSQILLLHPHDCSH